MLKKFPKKLKIMKNVTAAFQKFRKLSAKYIIEVKF